MDIALLWLNRYGFLMQGVQWSADELMRLTMLVTGWNKVTGLFLEVKLLYWINLDKLLS